MKLRTRDLFIRAMEEGYRYGIRRAFKYTDKTSLTEEELSDPARVDEMIAHIMTSLDEIIADWEDDEPQ